MQHTTLLNRFHQGLAWNGFLYGIYKLSSSLCTLWLFNSFSSYDFAAWATINSGIYFILLIIDAGFRKSIPRYTPEFAQNHTAYRTFITGIILFQLTLLLITTTVIYSCTPTIINFFTIPSHYHSLITGASWLLITEGLVAVLKLIFHAHFWHKQFNLIATAGLLLETTANILCMYTTHPNELLSWLFINKGLTSLVVLSVSGYVLGKNYQRKGTTKQKKVDQRKLWGAFAQHSGVMWGSNILKSLTERNVLVPLITTTVGAGAAGMFKIANEGALACYRMAAKTVGTTDTSLLAYTQTQGATESTWQKAFNNLATRVAALCIPLLGLVGVVYTTYYSSYSTDVFHLTTIMLSGYIIEMVFSPCERVLEVKRRYGLLVCAYAPYIVFLLLLFSTGYVTTLSLITLIMYIHSIRCVSSLCIAFITYRVYRLHLPYFFISSLFIITFLISSLSMKFITLFSM